MPSNSHFAVAMRSQKEAERAEQQRIKNLVLNYDLQDSSTDQAGTAIDLFDYFSHPNPNLPKPPGGFLYVVPQEMNTLAHNDSSEGLGGEKHSTSHHQHNASLYQSSNNSNARPVDKSGTNRSGHRARKLQLSDVDWYDQDKPDSSRSRGHGTPSRGARSRSQRGSRGSAG
jgi:regulator of nonsense transcripts 2